MRTELLRFNGSVERDPAIDTWMENHSGELVRIAHHWFEIMRMCRDEVRELYITAARSHVYEMRPSMYLQPM